MTTVPNMPITTVRIHGFACRVIRELKGRGVAELAEKLEVDRSYITKIELGHSPRVSTVFYSRLLTELKIADHRVLMADPLGSEVAA